MNATAAIQQALLSPPPSAPLRLCGSTPESGLIPRAEGRAAQRAEGRIVYVLRDDGYDPTAPSAAEELAAWHGREVDRRGAVLALSLLATALLILVMAIVARV